MQANFNIKHDTDKYKHNLYFSRTLHTPNLAIHFLLGIYFFDCNFSSAYLIYIKIEMEVDRLVYRIWCCCEWVVESLRACVPTNTFRNLGLGNIATRNLLCCNRKFHIVKGSYLQKINMDKRTHALLILTTVYSVQGVYHESKGQLKSYIALMG